MKVLFTSGIFPPDIGGPARMIEQLVTDLSQKKVDVTVLAFNKKKVTPHPFVVCKTQSKWVFCYKLWQLACKVDLVYTCDLYTAGFLSWLIGKKLLRKKLIVRFAGDSAWESALNKKQTKDDIVSFQKKKYSWQVELMKRFRSWVLKSADQVIAVSNFMKEVAQLIGVETSKIEVIYNSVDFVEKGHSVALDIKKKLGILSGEKIIMTAGRLVPWKGVDGLIKVAVELKKNQTVLPFKIIVVGDGPDKEKLEKLASDLGVKDLIVFVGKIPLEQIFNYYAIADVFILNSQYEGLSHVLLEVLSLGRPIIASACGGNLEVIENEKNGLLVEYNNVGEIVLAIKRILTEEKWQGVEYQNICQTSLFKFNWQQVVENTLAVFNKVLKT
ncbi:MAG: glycosyltransferase family 4 protein [Candidatus Magasanikbacteria bacterium]|nr:glycosyltransferase family 4 protein [Candidatus Magasanikbacteria bacterium]